MKNMKWILVAVMVLATMLSMCACGEATPTTNAPVTTAAPIVTTAAPTTTVDDGMTDYVVIVKYADGTPVANLDVQICLNDICYMPDCTDENGMVSFRLTEQDGYKTKPVVIPEGYEAVDYIYFESGSTEVTIVLVPVAG